MNRDKGLGELEFNIKIPVPGKFELFLAKLFGVRKVRSCMDCFIETYYWRGKFYVTKNWIDENWRDYENQT